MSDITPESFGKINNQRKERQLSIFNNSDKVTPISPEYVQILVDGITSNDKPISSAAASRLTWHAKDICEAYLKLHEENQRLQVIVDKQREALLELGNAIKTRGFVMVAHVWVTQAEEALALTATEGE